jgi:hypothetical protein
MEGMIIDGVIQIMTIFRVSFFHTFIERSIIMWKTMCNSMPGKGVSRETKLLPHEKNPLTHGLARMETMPEYRQVEISVII